MKTAFHRATLSRPLVLAIGVVISVALPSLSSATVILGSSSAFGVSTSLTLSLATLTVGPVPTASGTAPAPYSVSNPLATLTAGIPGISLSTAVLTPSASSNVDGTGGSKTTSASASVNNIALSIGLAAANLSFSAETVTSSAGVTGNFGSLAASGTSGITNASLSVNGVPVVVSSNRSPNTVLFNSGGLEIILNEQTVSGNGTSNKSIQVNAIDFLFTNFAVGTGLLNGNITISHSQASMNAVPEPASIVGLGALTIGLLRRRRRRI